ncbi:MAG: hypothetical protein PVG39_30335 [Desulfobacteraceae bacterium]|jgi:hypothetical protein
MKEILDKINEEISMWEGEVAGEKLSGNVVKESLAQGHVMGLKIAHQIISSHNTQINADRANKCPDCGTNTQLYCPNCDNIYL